jgi:hypothetical protein
LLALVLVLNAGMNAWKMGLGSWLQKALGWAAGFAVEWVLLWAVLNVLVYNFLPLGLVPVEEDPAYQGVTRIVEYFASHPEERARFAKEYGAFVRELDRLVSRGQLTADKAVALVSKHPEAYRAAAELAKIAWRPGLPALGTFVRDVMRGRVKGVAAVSTFAALVLSSVEMKLRWGPVGRLVPALVERVVRAPASKLERLVPVMASRGAACVLAAGWRLVAVLALVRTASAAFLFLAEVWPYAQVLAEIGRGLAVSGCARLAAALFGG